MNHDNKARGDFKEAPQSVVAWILMASWLYYHKPTLSPILSDSTFDSMCKWLYDNYDKVEHRYKHLISKEDLKAGSLYSLGSYGFARPLNMIAEKLSEEL